MSKEIQPHLSKKSKPYLFAVSTKKCKLYLFAVSAKKYKPHYFVVIDDCSSRLCRFSKEKYIKFVCREADRFDRKETHTRFVCRYAAPFHAKSHLFAETETKSDQHRDFAQRNKYLPAFRTVCIISITIQPPVLLPDTQHQANLQ